MTSPVVPDPAAVLCICCGTRPAVVSTLAYGPLCAECPAGACHCCGTAEPDDGGNTP